MYEAYGYGVVTRPVVYDANARVIFKYVLAALSVAVDRDSDTNTTTTLNQFVKPIGSALWKDALWKDALANLDEATAAPEGGEERDLDEFYAMQRTRLAASKVSEKQLAQRGNPWRCCRSASTVLYNYLSVQEMTRRLGEIGKDPAEKPQ